MEERLAREAKLLCFCNLGICESQLFLHLVSMLNLYLKGCGLLSHATAKKLRLSFLQEKSAMKGETGLMQRFHDVHTDTLCQTQEGLLNPWDLCRALGGAMGKTCSKI